MHVPRTLILYTRRRIPAEKGEKNAPRKSSGGWLESGTGLAQRYRGRQHRASTAAPRAARPGRRHQPRPEGSRRRHRPGPPPGRPGRPQLPNGAKAFFCRFVSDSWQSDFLSCGRPGGAAAPRSSGRVGRLWGSGSIVAPGAPSLHHTTVKVG